MTRYQQTSTSRTPRNTGHAAMAILSTVALSFGGLACGGTMDTNLEAAFCAGLGVTASTISATADATNAPVASLGEEGTEVTLVSDRTQNRGSITFNADESGHFAFGLNTNVPFSILDSTGQEVPLTRTVTGSEVCTELAVRHTAPLEIANYTISFGPTDASSIKVVAEESNDDLSL